MLDMMSSWVSHLPPEVSLVLGALYGARACFLRCVAMGSASWCVPARRLNVLSWGGFPRAGFFFWSGEAAAGGLHPRRLPACERLAVGHAAAVTSRQTQGVVGSDVPAFFHASQEHSWISLQSPPPGPNVRPPARGSPLGRALVERC